MDAEQIWGQPKDVYLGGSLCFILVVVAITQFSLRMCMVEENRADDCLRRSLWGNRILMPFFFILSFFSPFIFQVEFHDLVS